MKKLFLVCLLCSLLLGLACKKEEVIEPPIDPTVPVFSFNGSVNGTLVNIQAGVNNYYMYSSFYRSDTNMYSFVGNLKHVNCPCNNECTISLTDYKSTLSGGSSSIDSLLTHPLHYEHDSLSSFSYTKFYSKPTQNMKPQSYRWDFGDGSISTQQDPEHRYASSGYYTVCHTITYQNGCSSQICNLVKAQLPSDCKGFIGSSYGNGDTVYFSGEFNDSLSSIGWNFGDPGSGLNDTSISTFPIHAYSSPGIYLVKAYYRARNGCTAANTMRVVTKNYTGDCGAYFTYSDLTSTPSRFSVVTVTWIDSNGAVYSTTGVVQPSDSYFQVLSVENYPNNERDEPTKKIHAKVKCKLSNSIQSITMDGVDVVFAVSYK